MASMARAERDAYLARLGVEGAPPSAEELFRIHRAHVERVPYENLWIHLGERWDVAVEASVTRIARQGRGGYCFHLNGALSELLATLGYDVVRHVGGVHGPAGPSEQEMANHLVLTVHGLPSPENPGGEWYVDVGLGDALYEPLPLLPGAYVQPPWSFVLEQTPGAVGEWHLTHDPGGGFIGMAWWSAPTELGAFTARHEWLSTSPESGFVKVLTVQTRDAAGVTVLRGLTLKRIGAGALESVIASRTELIEVLREVFGLGLDHVGESAWRSLWSELRRSHEEWLATGSPR